MDITTYSSLYQAQVNDLNKNAGDLEGVNAEINRLRVELGIAEANFNALQDKRRAMKIAARGTLEIIRKLDEVDREAREKAENDQFI